MSSNQLFKNYVEPEEEEEWFDDFEFELESVPESEYFGEEL